MSEVGSAGGDADILPVSDLVVKPWARYGHDRWYVQTADGTGLGYLDNKTGATVLGDEAHRDAFDAALAEHHSGTASALPAVTVIPAQPTGPRPTEPAVSDTAQEPALAAPAVIPEPAPPRAVEPALEAVETVEADTLEAVEPDWQDLAAIKAGAAAREQADALKRAAPVKTFLARALGVKTDERAWRIGADAEEEVAARLAKLGDRWKILHAVPVGENGSDIDHVVIGPGGVFTINTKHHPDATIWVGGNTFMVNGTRTHYVRNSKFEAKRTAKFLTTALGGIPVFATGLIAVMGARGGFTIKSQPPDGDVVVMTRKEVAKWLAKRPEVLTDEQIEAVYSVARRSDTWREKPCEPSVRRRSRRT
jgi:hypothetical protein